MNFLCGIRNRFGDFWWWSLIVFLALRSGDIVNAVIGVWIVPGFVVRSELGAVLPISNLAAFLGTPIFILVVVLQKYLGRYDALGEEGKKKALLTGFVGFLVPAVVAIFAGAYLLMPLFFERVRVGRGSLALLIVAGAAIGTIQPLFVNALQALRKFGMLAFVNFVCAPVRLVVMVATMPFYALSGYMLGQCSGPVVQILLSAFSLRKEIVRGRPEPGFWRREWKGMAAYTVKVALFAGSAALASMVFSLIVRQRLPEAESAGYYMISRFAEMATYAGATLSSIMFPFAVSAVAKGRDPTTFLAKTQFGTLVAGALCVAAIAFLGRPLLNGTALWREYAVFSSDMTILATSLLFGMLATNYFNFEMAADRFGFLWVAVPVNVLQTSFLFAFTGYGYFSGILSAEAVEWMRSLRIDTLRNILLVGLFSNMLLFAGASAAMFLRRRIRHTP